MALGYSPLQPQEPKASGIEDSDQQLEVKILVPVGGTIPYPLDQSGNFMVNKFPDLSDMLHLLIPHRAPRTRTTKASSPLRRRKLADTCWLPRSRSRGNRVRDPLVSATTDANRSL
ncbi:hypothetical protein J6590_001935 [Homalodisca vitripennis]|nr:hypothetical protein J6590_001935 [Homalodisca vitripennis]